MEDGVVMQREGPDCSVIIDFMALHQMRNRVAASINVQRVVQAAQRGVDRVILAGGRVDIINVLVAAVEQDVVLRHDERRCDKREAHHQDQK